MTTELIGRTAIAVLLAAGLLAGIVTFVPSPFQILVGLFAVPVISLLLATATATPRRRAS